MQNVIVSVTVCGGYDSIPRACRIDADIPRGSCQELMNILNARHGQHNNCRCAKVCAPAWLLR